MSSSQQSEGNSNSNLSQPFPIVGIGASAGGLEALEDFFANVSEDSGMTYIVLVHSSPDQVSLLPEILQRRTSVNVTLVTDGETIHPNQIYIIPPQTSVDINQGCIELKSIPRREVLSSIDAFFCSLAQNQGQHSVGVILSGMGSDGTLGVKTIKLQEGLVIAQSKETALHQEMPHNAILTGVVDVILPPQSIPETIKQYFDKRPTINTRTSQQWLEQIFTVLRSQLGNDFSYYKPNTLTRRINRRMSLQQLNSYSEYLAFLQETPQEAYALYREFLIGVTNFFRDAGAFEFLQQEILPTKLRELSNNTFRVWVPGCSTGEEVYSIAIILREILDEIPKPIDLQIFGTDIDELAIDRAREGIFPAGIAANLSQQRLNRFFQQEGNYYRVSQEIRYPVVFSVQNLLKDPPFSRLNLLSCRNLLIYLNESAQKKLLPLFHYTLVSSGVLMLGSSETIGSFQNLFEPLSNKWKIFQHRELQQPQAQPIEFPTGAFRNPASGGDSLQQTSSDRKEETDWGKLFKEALLEQFFPTAVLIESNGLILYVQGRTGKFLETVSGTPTNNILDMAREGLQTELSSAIRTAASSGEIVTRRHIPVKSNGDTNLVKLLVKPLEKPKRLVGRLLVLLEIIEANLPSSSLENTTEDTSLQEKNNRIAELEKELQQTRENHQTTIEELESSNEELQATNEELESSNEELQATNEELESSKEELQSLNEELQTVNEELQNKVDELSAAENDVQNFLNSTEFATLFVDAQMQVKRFTPEVTTLINLIPRDIGRPVQDLSTNLIQQDLITDLQQVLETLNPKTKAVQTIEKKWYSMQILPYRTAENRIEGAIVTFIDIDEWKKAQDELERVNNQLEQTKLAIRDLIEASSEPLVLLDENRKILAVSQPFQELIAFLPRRNLSDWEALLLQQLESELNSEDDFSDAELVISFSDQRRDRYLIDGKVMGHNSTEFKYFLLKIKPENSDTNSNN